MNEPDDELDEDLDDGIDIQSKEEDDLTFFEKLFI